MIRFGVLGCGRIGRMHADNLAAHPKAELAWAYDVARPAAVAVAEAHGCRVAGTVAEVLDDTGVDAVLIASSTDTHVELITAAAKAHKAILCEKPIDLDIAKVDACWKEIGGLGVPIQIGFNRRYDPSFAEVQKRDPRRRDRRPAPGDHHQPRPRDPARRLHEGRRRPPARHDHPRFRPRPLPARRGAGRGRGVRQRPDRAGGTRPGRERHRHDPPAHRQRPAVLHHQLQQGHLRLRPADRGRGRARHAQGREPPRHHASSAGTASAPRPRTRSSTSSSSATARPMSASSTTSSTPSRRAAPATRASRPAGGRCCWPTRPTSRSRAGRSCGWQVKGGALVAMAEPARPPTRCATAGSRLHLHQQ